MKLKEGINPRHEVNCPACPYDATGCPDTCPTIGEVYKLTSDWKKNFQKEYCDE